MSVIVFPSRTQTPLRSRKARSDGSVRALAASTEAELGLPPGCFLIVAPNGRKIRGDASVATLRKRWGQIDRFPSRSQTSVRFRKARSDGSVRALAASTEAELGLPRGCVRVVAPNGRKIRGDASVATLRKRWGQTDR
jgi:hypothetical protein